MADTWLILVTWALLDAVFRAPNMLYSPPSPSPPARLAFHLSFHLLGLSPSMFSLSLVLGLSRSWASLWSSFVVARNWHTPSYPVLPPHTTSKHYLSLTSGTLLLFIKRRDIYAYSLYLRPSCPPLLHTYLFHTSPSLAQRAHRTSSVFCKKNPHVHAASLSLAAQITIDGELYLSPARVPWF